jgi:hypothetical protein
MGVTVFVPETRSEVLSSVLKGSFISYDTGCGLFFHPFFCTPHRHILDSVLFSGCSDQQLGCPFLFKDLEQGHVGSVKRKLILG